MLAPASVVSFRLLSLSAIGAVALPSAAHARRPHRSGGQVELISGVSACVPGAANCRHEDATLSGRTAPMVGLGINLGYRFRRSLLMGVGYAAGFFDPRYEWDSGEQPRLAYQQGLFLVARGILPIRRFDLGFELSPGVSRVVLRSESGDNRTYSQGFALRPGVSLDYWLGRRWFLGGKADLTFNLHRNVCVRSGDESNCHHKRPLDVVAVHQLIAGLHVGGSF
ncbi:MAG: hypothetical protein B7733_20370 [Myxococcales bacterium FL481]|nr:MAG: hypothetical protein B7733_20370 [Myxococcales bacterium FL481]